MKIILKEDVVGVGDIGETVSVKAGFARNYLIPRGFAMEAQTTSAKVIAHKMRQVEAKKKRMQSAAEEHAEKMNNVSVTLPLRVGSGGKVFGAITTRDIAQKLGEQGFEIDRRRVLLSEPIKKTGTHFVEVKLHPEIKVRIRLDVEVATATKEEEEKETAGAREALERKSEAASAGKDKNSDQQLAEKQPTEEVPVETNGAGTLEAADVQEAHLEEARLEETRLEDVQLHDVEEPEEE